MMPLKEVLASLKTWVIAAVAVIVGSVLTLLATSYVDFQKTNHSIAMEDFDKLNTTATELYQILLAYSNKARTGVPVDDITQRRFAEVVLKLDAEARINYMREPGTQKEFTEYENALVSLKEAADNLQGPLNGKGFVETISRYFVAQTKFTSEILKAQRSFINDVLT
jgi:hypothetical protein